MKLRRCDSLPSRLRVTPDHGRAPNGTQETGPVEHIKDISDRDTVIAKWNSLRTDVKKIKNGFPTSNYLGHERKETITHNFTAIHNDNNRDERRKITNNRRVEINVEQNHNQRNSDTDQERGAATRKTLLQRLLSWRTTECNCSQKYKQKSRPAPKPRAEQWLCTCGMPTSRANYSSIKDNFAERGRSKSVGYEATREVTQFRRCASAGPSVGVETAAALRARAALTLARRYYPEGGWGWTITIVGTIVQILTHGLQLGGGTGAIACTAAVKFQVSPLYTHGEFVYL